ncbi:methyltransferase domain-containing protein [Paenibacillus profundus]|uniref:Malonyl-[acyl-carrier protein] O-methyltransferase n=1 Tax=Paenibacillus profundus TaxID=1173085 RepID=A0ABS8YKY9_9BACL|nr:methyltransferase [Paenibacillus profundus]MCE5170932.1 methyltransferase domain-containing protein [Paenibacillus profundus]
MTTTSDSTETPRPFLGANVNKSLVQRRFDKHAHEYDSYAEVQRVMAHELAQRISMSYSGPVSRIADIGCGTGLLTLELLRLFPEASATLVDMSPQMVRAACTKLEQFGTAARRLDPVIADAEAWVQEQGGQRGSRDRAQAYDLIVSSAAFQWFNRPAETVGGLLRLLAPGGVLAFATFMPGTLYELHESFGEAESALGLPAVPRGLAYPAREDWLGWLSAPVGAAVSEADERAADTAAPTDNLSCITAAVSSAAPAALSSYKALPPSVTWEEASYRYAFPDVPAMLQQVRRVGAGNAVASSAAAGALNRTLYRKMVKCYHDRYRLPDGRIPLTYEVAYGIVELQT